jgi:hypothetical protein
MTRRERSAEREASNDPVDPLEEALRQMGADMLAEPVPERLRQVLRQARGALEAEPRSQDEPRSQRADRRQ